MMDLLEIRRTIVTAIAADDYLVERLVLKGGNALELVHHIGARASVDLDFSTEADLESPAEVEARLERSLHDRFERLGLLVFDFRFISRPSNRKYGSPWGGYNGSFKLIEREVADRLGGKVDDMRRQSQVIGSSQRRDFKIEISVYEYVQGCIEVDVDDFACLVYSLDMIAAEKLRAICQQAPGYELRKHPTSRARDFYDIVCAVRDGGVSLSDPPTQELVSTMFAAKRVPLHLLAELEGQRNFHREDWSSVENAVRVTLRDFDYYFDYVLEEVRGLESLWIEHPPA